VESLILETKEYVNGKGFFVRAPRLLLRELVSALRHYPTKYDLLESAKKAPEIWGEPNE